MTKECVFVDVFTDKPFTGNQLAVFPDANGLSTEYMQKLANEINYSETTFVSKWNSPEADHNVRIFTLDQELPFAGHPILGTAFTIMQLSESWDATIRLKTKVGVIPLKKANGEIWMTQNHPDFFEQFSDKNIVADLIGLTPDDISDDIPIEAVSTGNTMLIIPVKDLKAIESAEGNAHNLRIFCKKHNVVGPYLFTLQTTTMAARVHTRFLAPHMGILEDAATGSAAGPLTGYLLKHDVFGRSFEIINEQGIEMNRPSQIHMRGMLNKGTYTVEIGGQCVNVGHAEFVV
jgi:trans-2,3-dihydro-3-hydroxyanthranilate isomerase